VGQRIPSLSVLEEGDRGEWYYYYGAVVFHPTSARTS